MTRTEIYAFIEKMEEIGDIWKFEDVERVYKNFSLEEAIRDRQSNLGTFFDIIGKIINR